MTMEQPRMCIGLIAWFLVISSVSARSGNETDKDSLLEFKAKIEHDPLGLFKPWNDSVHFCSWPGVVCSQRHRQRVTMLNLPSSKLSGQLSPHIGNLSFLRVLNLENNSFSRDIPQEIGRLFRLRELRFRNNSFAGEIPANISGCFSLRILNMLNNNFTGRIPKEIGSLSELRTIVLGNKNLVGEIPASVGNLSLLEQLYLGESSFQGNIPISFGQLKSLETLVLQRNNLTGTVPVALYNISSLKVISMLQNKLEGSLPPNLGLTLPKLQFFSVARNYLSGSIPVSVSNASNLLVFELSNNKLVGNIPSFARPLNLRSLGMGHNNLGFAENDDLDFLHHLVNNTRLEGLGIEQNNLGGEILETIGNLSSRLRRLTLGFNKITGEIPTGIGNLVSLEGLGLEANDLTGPIPSTIGKLRNMIVLTFDSNKLSGTIPPSMRNLTSLTILSLARNNLQGIIPPSLGECRNLQLLTLAENNLSGNIPPQVFSLPSLTRYLGLSKNQLAGSIPIEVGKLVNLGELDISENNISGQIPKSISSCTSMQYLKIQGNFLQGSVPEELSALRGVQVIDFSRNKFSGQVPIHFWNFQGLQFLNFSFNEFEGQVPLQGIFKNASKFSITGNSRLCGGLPELKLPICKSPLIKTRELSAKKKLFIIVSSSIVGLMVLIFLTMLVLRSRKRSKPITQAFFPNSLPRVSYEDLSKATGEFATKNVIGIGSFGSVYKGILSREERHVAVKVLNLDITRTLKSFIVECESLGSIRHRNIVKLVTVCSSIDFCGNDFKALVYEYMVNGNLDEWLHSSNRGQEQIRHLNLIQRIGIAIDVASALDYLHNHCSEQIAHCDIKPSNILLDGQMVAHLGDFGLAKLLRSAFSSSNNQSSSNGVRGTVGYIPPEYATGSEVSTLGDTYSYGILLLELLCGKRPTDNIFNDDFNLHSFASLALHEENTREIFDLKMLEEEGQRIGNGTRCWDDQAQELSNCLMSIIEIGVLCSSKSPEERRNMGDVAAELCRIRNVLRRTLDG